MQDPTYSHDEVSMSSINSDLLLHPTLIFRHCLKATDELISCCQLANASQFYSNYFVEMHLLHKRKSLNMLVHAYMYMSLDSLFI